MTLFKTESLCCKIYENGRAWSTGIDKKKEQKLDGEIFVGS